MWRLEWQSALGFENFKNFVAVVVDRFDGDVACFGRVEGLALG